MIPTPNNSSSVAQVLAISLVSVVTVFSIAVPQAQAFSLSDIPGAVEDGIDWVQDKIDTAEGILASSEQTVGAVLEGEQVLDGCQAVQGFSGDAFPGTGGGNNGGGDDGDDGGGDDGGGSGGQCGSTEFGNLVTVEQACERKCDRLLEDTSEKISDYQDGDGSFVGGSFRFDYYRPDNCQDIQEFVTDNFDGCTTGRYYCSGKFGQLDKACVDEFNDGGDPFPESSTETCDDRAPDTDLEPFEKRTPDEFKSDEGFRMRQEELIPGFRGWVVDNPNDNKWVDAESWDGRLSSQNDSAPSFCRQVAEIDGKLVCPSELENYVEPPVGTTAKVDWTDEGCFRTVIVEGLPDTGSPVGRSVGDPPSCDQFDMEALEDEYLD